MERIILSRIIYIIERHLPQAQAGFRKNRSTDDQITRLVNDIESSFQRKEKYGLLLIDLTAAYDTVWHRGLYMKLLRIIPDVKLVKFIMTMIQNRSFYVETSSGERSRKRMLRNGLPQGSVLAPILFNIYTSDIPPTISKQFLYADDSALGTSGTFESVERILELDLAKLSHYFHQWHLKLSESKTVCSVFHLANRLANKEITIQYNGLRLKFEREPVYLGVTLDRSLTFKAHLRKVAEKTSKRVNLIKKLAGCNWGANFNTLRTSTLSLVYSTAEYAAPVWSHSSHTKLVDVVINDALRLISGCILPTPVDILPVLAGIPPSHIRRDHAVLKLAAKSHQPDSLVPAPTPVDAPPQRITRHSFTTRARAIMKTQPLF